MKGLVPTEDPAQTREDLPEVRAVGLLADEGIGVIVPRQEAYAGRSIDYPDQQENIYHAIKVPRHSAARALDKPEQSSYEQIGKPPIFGRPHARRAFTINRKTLTIDQSSIDGRNTVGKVMFDKSMAIARGFQMALADGANIAVPSSAPSGSQREIPGASSISLTDLYQR